MTLEMNWREVEGILTWDHFFYLETGSFNLLRVEIWECDQGLEEADMWSHHWAEWEIKEK